MKQKIVIILFSIFVMQASAQPIFIATRIGKIAVYVHKGSSSATPVIFLHGVYFDHHLWDEQIKELSNRTVITLDMPLHGMSRTITKSDWNLQDCASMLIEILDSLKVSKVIAIGHSWGSMSILRAAYQHPGRFDAVGLFNMPFQAVTTKQKIIFGLQHTLLSFRSFYTRQAASVLFGRTAMAEKPQLLSHLRRTMEILSNREIRQVDKKVIFDAEDASQLTRELKVKAIALRGEEDYLPAPPGIETRVIKGGHVSPLSNPAGTSACVLTLLEALDKRKQ
ncbi:hypothetical protein LBMAG25_14680 [Bacteroidota bacterium]|nr:hypothetical protein LBMAG25_14680 [Bacteroidota bacterium]